MSLRLGTLALVTAALAFGCGTAQKGGPAASVGLMMSFGRDGGFFTAPFPSDDLRRADGTIDLSGFPNPNASPLVTAALSLASTNVGFGCSSGAFFEATGPVNPSTLPSLAGSITDAASVFVIGIDPESPDYLTRHVVEVQMSATPGVFSPPYLLSVVPLQGMPLLASTEYAVVVRTSVKDTHGASLSASTEVATLASGGVPVGLRAEALPIYQAALAALSKLGIEAGTVAGVAAFTTDDPVSEAALFRADVLSRPPPAPDAPFTQTDLFDEYCVYESTIPMPDYQAGVPPFDVAGGGWEVDPSGNPILQRNEEARIFVTVPRKPIPHSGFPISIFVRTGGGGDRPLVDRGTQAANGGPPLVPGTGPALFFARAGYVGVSVDGPLGGLRNTTNANEDYTVFNIFNPLALRDNLRQSALELMLQAHLVPTLSFDVSDCPGAIAEDGGTTLQLRADSTAIMGHSMGATIAPLAVALEPDFKSVVLSGAGASWIENMLYKQMPMNVRPLLELLLEYDNTDGQVLTEYDPILSLFQWAIEPGDPQVYDSRVIDNVTAGAKPRQVLMFQGIVDHYILPDIANATTLTLGIDLAGVELDQSPDEPPGQTLVSSLLPLVGRRPISLPASGNLTATDGTTVTGVLIQAPGDAVEDGHEVVFQTDGPKHQYECFLASALVGVATVPPPDSADASCP